ncbi:MAG: hypothetical protein HYY41_04685 [Chloroflexi bacterium]|nr:hypothetical protein [Chloroflexota bacterium]
MYDNVIWLDNRTSPIYRKFIENLFNQLGEYYDEFIRKTDIMPFYYGERPQIGHIAQSASRCQYISVQDYNVNIPDKLRRGLKTNYVPDLLIWVPARGQKPYTCVFEAKAKHWTSIDTHQDRLTKIILDDLTEANKQISRHGYEEGRFRCALVAIRVYCTYRKWKSMVKKPSVYNDKIDGLIEKIKCGLDECRKREHKPNFWWRYFAEHDAVTRTYGQEKVSPTLGVFWVGSIKQY